MVGEAVDFSDAANSAKGDGISKDSNERSTIEFPYVPLEAAIEVATALYNRCGFSACDQDELAAQMGQNISGAFRQKTSAARTFGLIDKDGRSAFVLTELGKKIVSSFGDSAAKVESFLSVPLYTAVYEKFRGHQLPPTKALEREMEKLGVSSKQTERARQVFERSAQFAGFFESGKDRLVRPRIESSPSFSKEVEIDTKPLSEQKPERELDRRSDGGGSGGGIPPGIDPIIVGLITRLPKTGTKWPKAKRKLWLQILENSFDLVYEDDGDLDDL